MGRRAVCECLTCIRGPPAGRQSCCAESGLVSGLKVPGALLLVENACAGATVASFAPVEHDTRLSDARLPMPHSSHSGGLPHAAGSGNGARGGNGRAVGSQLWREWASRWIAALEEPAVKRPRTTAPQAGRPAGLRGLCKGCSHSEPLQQCCRRQHSLPTGASWQRPGRRKALAGQPRLVLRGSRTRRQ